MTASLVVQTSFIGDMVLTTPLIAELAKLGPVDVIATPITAPLLANDPAVRRVIRYDKRGAERGMVGLWRSARNSRALFAEYKHSSPKYDAAYLAQGSVRTAILARLIGANEHVGFSTSAGRALYTRVVEYREDRHHAERLWRLATWRDTAAPAPPGLRPRLHVSDSDRKAVDQLLAASGAAGRPMLVLAPGSAWETKRWPHFPELAEELGGEFTIAIVGGSGDGNSGIKPTGEPIVDATGRLSLLGSAELIRRAAAIVTNDSAPLHLASAVNTPTVAVFGPTVPDFGFGALSDRRAVAGLVALPCRPCHRHGPRRCPLGHWRCMRELSAQDVAGLVRSVLS